MGRLDGKVALISGGARGQGACEARLFAAEGAKVMVGDVLDDEGDALARELTSDRAAYRHHDVTDEGQWSAIVTEAVERFGQLDILVNNAGIFRILPMMQTSLDDYRQINDVNQIGVFLGMKAASPALVERGGGSIVNISSIAGLRGSQASFAYSASKWAVRGMTKCAALELAPFKVRVNSIHPGIIDTPMAQEFVKFGVLEAVRERIPMGELAQPEEVARLALFLAVGRQHLLHGGRVHRRRGHHDRPLTRVSMRATRLARFRRHTRRRTHAPGTSPNGPPSHQGNRRVSSHENTVRPSGVSTRVNRPSPVTTPVWRTPMTRGSSHSVIVMRSVSSIGPKRVSHSNVAPTPLVCDEVNRMAAASSIHST